MNPSREFSETLPIEYSRAQAGHVAETIRRMDRIANVLVVLAVGALLAWLLWEWAACTASGALACSLSLVAPCRRPAGTQQPEQTTTASINLERLHACVDAAYRSGHDDGYAKGFRSGGRYGRVMYMAAGAVLGAAAVAAALASGLGQAGAV